MSFFFSIRLIECNQIVWSSSYVHTMTIPSLVNIRIVWLLQLFVLSLSLPTDKMKESKSCREDNDCSERQYCYEVSARCVDYTQCHRYNRQEAQDYARDPSQCGPCISGYVAEVLGTGEQALLCKRVPFKGNNVEHDNGPIAGLAIIISVVLIFVSCLAIGLFIFCYLKKPNPTNRDERKKYNDDCLFGPSAPPPENSPFIAFGEHLNSKSTNNNRNLKDKNILVSAVPCKEPDWIQTNPHYVPHFHNESMDAPDQAHSPPQIAQDEDTNPSSWTPEQLTIQVPSRPFSIFATEQRDNAANAVIVQRSCPASGSSSEEGNTANGTNSQSTENPGERDNHIRGSNVLITQKITMNVNVLNGDC